jgi:hypothetical protein
MIEYNKKLEESSRGLFTIKDRIEGINYSVRISNHADEQLDQRDLSEVNLKNTFFRMGRDKFIELKKNKKEHEEYVMIINEFSEISILVTVEKNRVYIITVIDENDPWVKNNTEKKVIA